MKKIKSIQEVIDHRLCISCGSCVNIADQGSMKMVLDETEGIYKPNILDTSKVSGTGREFSVCPGPGFAIDSMSKKLFGSDLKTTPEFGRYRNAFAAQSTNKIILKHASSGGVMTTIALWLKEQKQIDGATVVRFQRTKNGPRTVSYIARTQKDFIHAQGSKYCPTSTNELITECKKAGGKYLFIGTPCQVAALRLSMDIDSSLKLLFPFTMANFCGGYRDFRYLDGVIRAYGLDPRNNRYFRFRGGGWPGSMLAEDIYGKRCSHPYPFYQSAQYVVKQKRCTLCIDGTGLLADFACGDAWIDRFTKGDLGPGGWSIIIARSASAEKALKGIISGNLIKTAPVDFKDLLHSQRYNLSSKINRQKKRIKLLSLLGQVVPEWDVHLPEGSTSYVKEATILVQKTVLYQNLKTIWHRTPVYKTLRFLFHLVKR